MTYIVAEMSSSHDGCLDKALKLVEVAKECGANAIKLQTFEPEELCADENYIIEKGAWIGWNLLELYKKAHTPKSWHKTIFNHAREVGIECFSTPFHPNDVDFLETLDCPKYKISSFDIINHRLIKSVVNTNKPVILSTGMASREEVDSALEFLCGGPKLTLLHCVSEYPAIECNLSKMTKLREWGFPVGLSDHSKLLTVPIAAAALGASIIEKHICLADGDGLDGDFALRPGQFAEMVSGVRAAELAIGYPRYGQETSCSNLRPSLYYSRDIGVGEVLVDSDFKIARPGRGLHPRYMDDLIGSTLTRDVKKNDPA